MRGSVGMSESDFMVLGVGDEWGRGGINDARFQLKIH